MGMQVVSSHLADHGLRYPGGAGGPFGRQPPLGAIQVPTIASGLKFGQIVLRAAALLRSSWRVYSLT